MKHLNTLFKTFQLVQEYKITDKKYYWCDKIALVLNIIK